MSNLTPTPDPTPTPQGVDPKPEDPKPEAPAQDPTDWKSEARKWESLAKKNKDAADELARIEEESKTEAQKQAEELAALQSKVTEYETREQIAAWKSEVSAETGVPVNVLAGSTKEDIAAHAETLKPLISQTPTGPQPISGEGQAGALALNGDGIESALKSALGIK